MFVYYSLDHHPELCRRHQARLWWQPPFASGLVLRSTMPRIEDHHHPWAMAKLHASAFDHAVSWFLVVYGYWIVECKWVLLSTWHWRSRYWPYCKYDRAWRNCKLWESAEVSRSSNLLAAQFNSVVPEPAPSLVSFPEISLLLSHIISRLLLQMPLDLRKSLNVLRNHSYDFGSGEITTCWLISAWYLGDTDMIPAWYQYDTEALIL